MTNPSFVYTTYINTTPEQLWKALTEPAFTERYWGTRLESDWKPGSPLVWHEAGATMADREQVVLEADPPRRLSYTWHTFTPEWAESHGFDEALRARLAAEPRSKVTFELEPAGPAVKLTVVHDGFEPGSEVAEMCSAGWPVLLSDLKSLLETGAPVPKEAASAA